MPERRCPGLDQRYWKPEDISMILCPFCQGEIEFWKDEPLRQCPTCRKEVRNPKLDTGCAEWCHMAHECLDAAPSPTRVETNAQVPGERPKGST